ncbi:hypothetical protein [Candidatus Manganitrophus noduliformans]|uniref:Uncharacterized protein n=1 Tax=Candidatus Manganitrophus noduliformans TaxID=2606439 RepID=A0A7X6ID83_9BACT|nr:hypothetical protein [Candidatus Manganitrophus noduliformans]NKE73341.1 hypothetical protein [Candidatus Manganitrophus noduliformans]
MKRRTGLVLIGIWMGTLLFGVFPAGAEGEKVVHPVRPVQSERDLGSDRSATVEPEDRGGGGLDDPLEFEARRETPPPQREAEALRFHQNSTLERFENADAHGQLVLSFSSEGVELKLRSITGAEAPVAGANRSPEE